jgi:hypothetical protein
MIDNLAMHKLLGNSDKYSESEHSFNSNSKLIRKRVGTKVELALCYSYLGYEMRGFIFHGSIPDQETLKGFLFLCSHSQKLP